LSEPPDDRQERGRGRPASRAYWICQALGWGLYVVVATVQNLEPPGLSAAAAGEIGLAAGIGLALTHRLRRFILERGWLSLHLRSLVPRALAAPIVLALAFVVPLWLVERYALGMRPPSPGLVLLFSWVRWTGHFFAWEATYLGVGLLRGWRRAEADRRELASALAAAQLRSLQSQLNPHFLFNALNTVRALIAEDPARAQAAVTQIASILRHALGSGQDDLVTFESEMAVVEDYLAIEALRLGDRLRVERTIEPSAARTRIPAMLLQTLVENAVKHGIAELREGGTLAIDARVDGGAMRLTVENPRPPEEQRLRSLEAGNGIGLTNASERLRLLFGADARLDMDLSTPRRATARVRIPLRP
jgi:two-component sensor histidine kinase